MYIYIYVYIYGIRNIKSNEEDIKKNKNLKLCVIITLDNFG